MPVSTAQVLNYILAVTWLIGPWACYVPPDFFASLSCIVMHGLNYFAGLLAVCSFHVLYFTYAFQFQVFIMNIGVNKWRWVRQKLLPPRYEADLLTTSTTLARGLVFKSMGDLKRSRATFN